LDRIRIIFNNSPVFKPLISCMKIKQIKQSVSMTTNLLKREAKRTPRNAKRVRRTSDKEQQLTYACTTTILGNVE
jgi:hypothetical protein